LGATVTERDTAVIVSIRGEIDMGTAAVLEHALVDAMECGKDVALDMAEVDFIDSAGLRELVLASASLVQQGHRLVVCAMSPTVARVLSLSGVDAVLRGRPGDAASAD
jgi:stage II sporulation protein AA (anti-sigma F factor antagonist)